MPESNCRPQPKDIDPKYLSVLEPFGNAVHTVTQFDVKDQIVAIVGCGPIGLMAVNLAKVMGAKKVIAVEIDEYRIKMAKDLGADVCVNPIEEDVVARMMEESDQKGIDVICEFSGNAGAMEAMFKYVGLNGKISILGIPRKDLTIDFANDVVFKGVTIYGVVGRKMYETWDKAAEIVKTGKVDFEKIVTNTFPLEDFQKAIDLMKSGKCGKIVLIPNHK
jgi:threonine 3-dehydrogenase